ncbi:MAG TPA: hypothetical protein VLH79_00575 [Chthonomonadales bacterium]|nr:hypothetical protein [Chthonomonadales bacterium]
MKRTRNRRWAPWVAVAVCACTAVLVMAQTRGNSNERTASAAERPEPAAERVAIEPAPPARRPLDHYLASVRGSLFSPAAPPVRAAPAAAVQPLPAPAAAPVNPFADYTYAGSVNLGGRALALVEHRTTRQGQYLAQGDSFMGGEVSQVGERSITIQVAGTAHILSKSDSFSLTPLDRPAAFLTAPAPGQAGAPGQPGGPPGMTPGGAPGAAPGAVPFPGFERLPQRTQERVRERMQNMTPEQIREASERFRDRAFEGRGRRGRSGDGDGG